MTKEGEKAILLDEGLEVESSTYEDKFSANVPVRKMKIAITVLLVVLVCVGVSLGHAAVGITSKSLKFTNLNQYNNITWKSKDGLPDPEGENIGPLDPEGEYMEVKQLATDHNDAKNWCQERLHCVGFSYCENDNIFYAKKRGTWFEPPPEYEYQQKWAGERWTWHYIIERATIQTLDARVADVPIPVSGKTGKIFDTMVPLRPGGMIDVPETEKKVGLELVSQKIIPPGTRCSFIWRDSDNCTLHWRMGDTSLGFADLDFILPDQTLVIIVGIKSEELASPGLVGYVRTLPVSADHKAKILKNMGEQGVYRRSQMGGLTMSAVTQGTGLDGYSEQLIQNRLSEEAAQQDGGGGAAEITGQQAETLEAIEKPMEMAEEKRKEAEEEAKKILEEVETDSKQTRDRMSERTKKSLREVHDSLDALKLTNADTRLTEARKQIEEIENSGRGGAHGEHWSLMDLILRNGVLRGVELNGHINQNTMKMDQEIHEILLGEVVQFKPIEMSMSDATLTSKIMSSPIDSSREKTFVTSNANDMQHLHKEIDTVGEASANSDRLSASLGLAFVSPEVGGGVVLQPLSIKKATVMGQNIISQTLRLAVKQQKLYPKQSTFLSPVQKSG